MDNDVFDDLVEWARVRQRYGFEVDTGAEQGSSRPEQDADRSEGRPPASRRIGTGTRLLAASGALAAAAVAVLVLRPTAAPMNATSRRTGDPPTDRSDLQFELEAPRHAGNTRSAGEDASFGVVEVEDAKLALTFKLVETETLPEVTRRQLSVRVHRDDRGRRVELAWSWERLPSGWRGTGAPGDEGALCFEVVSPPGDVRWHRCVEVKESARAELRGEVP